MRRRAHIFALILWAAVLCLASAGCADIGIWNESLKELSLSSEEASEAIHTAAASPEESEGKTDIAVSEDVSDSNPAIESFLMEEAFSFARSSLSEAEQIWYDDMAQILGSFGVKVKLNVQGLEAGLNENDIDKIFQCVLGDHPELFYVEGYSYTKYMRGGQLVSIDFSGTYNVDVDTAMERKEEILAAAEEILAGIEENASDYEKVKYVYDAVIRNTDYDLNISDNQNIYSVFAYHLSVCQGYAKATQYLLNRLGVECALVLGEVDTGESHAWNLVKVDDNYYFVDTTWGDVSYQKDDSDREDKEDYQLALPEINYDFLNVTTDELLRTHVIGGVVDLPVCIATEANYYVKEGALFTSYDKAQMAELFQKAEDSGQDSVTIKCSDIDCYNEIAAAMIEEQEIFAYLKGEGSIAYTRNEKQYSLTFWVANE